MVQEESEPRVTIMAYLVVGVLLRNTVDANTHRRSYDSPWSMQPNKIGLLTKAFA